MFQGTTTHDERRRTTTDFRSLRQLMPAVSLHRRGVDRAADIPRYLSDKAEFWVCTRARQIGPEIWPKVDPDAEDARGAVRRKRSAQIGSKLAGRDRPKFGQIRPRSWSKAAEFSRFRPSFGRNSTRRGRNSTKRGRHWLTLALASPRLPWAAPGEASRLASPQRPKFGRIRPRCAKFGPDLAEIGQTPTDPSCGRLRPRHDRHRTKIAEISCRVPPKFGRRPRWDGTGRVCARLGRNRQNTGRTGPNVVEVAPNSAKLGPNLMDIGQVHPKTVHFWLASAIDFGQSIRID